MEKYAGYEGVDQEYIEKKASQGCPICGRKDLNKYGSVILCPVHGSEPFEERDDV